MLTNRRTRTLALSCAIIGLSFLSAGCWDRKEIENRGFVLGVAIDQVEPASPKGQYDLTHVTQEAGQRKYRATFELPRFQKQEGEKSAGEAARHYIFAGEGESLLAITRSINAKTYFSLFFEDIQIIVFSEAVAREGIGDLLDFFFRNPGMRRRVKMFVTPGRAEDILTGKLQVGEANSLFFAKTERNVRIAPRFASIISLADVAETIQAGRPIFMAEIIMENGDAKLTKVAIFNKEQKMVGELDEWEIVGAKILRKILKGGAFSVPNPANPDKLAVFELHESHIDVEPRLDGDRLAFALEARLVGDLGENTEPDQDALDPAFQAAVERALADEFTRQTLAAYHKMQELKAEVADLGSMLHRQQPEYWKMVKDRWDEEVFPTVPLTVNIKVTVRRPGTVR